MIIFFNVFLIVNTLLVISNIICSCFIWIFLHYFESAARLCRFCILRKAFSDSYAAERSHKVHFKRKTWFCCISVGMQGMNINTVRGNKISLALIILICTTLVIWACNKVAILGIPHEQLDILYPGMSHIFFS